MIVDRAAPPRGRQVLADHVELRERAADGARRRLGDLGRREVAAGAPREHRDPLALDPRERRVRHSTTVARRHWRRRREGHRRRAARGNEPRLPRDVDLGLALVHADEVAAAHGAHDEVRVDRPGRDRLERGERTEVEGVCDLGNLGVPEPSEHAVAAYLPEDDIKMAPVGPAGYVERARAQLIERHMDIPVRAANIIYPRVKDQLEFDELVSLGNAGLTEAGAALRGGSRRHVLDVHLVPRAGRHHRRHPQGHAAAAPPRVAEACRCCAPPPSTWSTRAKRNSAGAVKSGVAIPTGPDALAKVKYSRSARFARCT